MWLIKTIFGILFELTTYGVASPSGHTPKFDQKKAKRAGPIPKPAWPILKHVWHPPNPRLSHAKVGGGRDKVSLGRYQARVPRPPTCRPPRRPAAESGLVHVSYNGPRAWNRPSGTWLCAKSCPPPILSDQALWAQSKPLVALGHAGLWCVPRRACNTIYRVKNGLGLEVEYLVVPFSSSWISWLVSSSRMWVATYHTHQA
jgi:hypothetical protein